MGPEADDRERHADETSACRNVTADSGQRSRRLLLAHGFQMGIPTVARARSPPATNGKENDNTHSMMDDQVTRPSWKLREPEARRVAHSIRLRLGTTEVFSLGSISCLAACAETDAPSSRDRNAPAALMSAKTAKARMSEMGRRSASSLQNVLSQSMPCCCSISRPAAANASCTPANKGIAAKRSRNRRNLLISCAR
jgi:hypothetical protein